MRISGTEGSIEFFGNRQTGQSSRHIPCAETSQSGGGSSWADGTRSVPATVLNGIDGKRHLFSENAAL
jgi:hypothetical protein